MKHVMFNLVIVWLLLSCTGCGTPLRVDDIKDLIDEADALKEWLKSAPDIVSPKKDEAPDHKFVDDIPADKIVWHGGRNPGGYKLTHDLKFEGKFGGQVRLIQAATSEWANPKKFDVIGNVWYLRPRQDGSGMWDAYEIDYIRPGQTLRHWPWKTGKDYGYPPVDRNDSFGVCLTTLTRDWRTNGEMRCRTVKVQ